MKVTSHEIRDIVRNLFPLNLLRKLKMSTLITPTVGRKVWFRAPEALEVPAFAVEDREQPMDATIVYVHNDRKVNLAVQDHRGNQHSLQNVLLLQGDEDYNPVGCYCEWMVYQKAQAEASAASDPATNASAA